MLRLFTQLCLDTALRALALWSSLALIAWVSGAEGLGPQSLRWLSLAAPLALVWSYGLWHRAGGPQAWASLGRRPRALLPAFWLAAAGLSVAAPTPHAPEHSLLLQPAALSWHPPDAPPLRLRWRAGALHRSDTAHAYPGFPAPEPALEAPPSPPYRGARLLSLALLLWSLHRKARPPGPLAALGYALLAFAAAELLPLLLFS